MNWKNKFMKNYLILIIVGVAGIIAGSYFGRRRRQRMEEKKEPLMERQTREKEENLEKIRGLFDGGGRVANGDVEKLLGVSDATATRYLDELEKEGFIRQVGKTGQHVYYEKI